MPSQLESFPNKNTTAFLSGASEISNLIRLFDWNSTTLGSIETWPQSLRTTLGIIVNSKFPMFLFWGEELLCFYNDAYRSSIGNDDKHPSALGQPGEKVWSEIWPVIKPLIDQVLTGGEATWSEDQLIPMYRNGSMEDVYWTFSYSPVFDEAGKPGGVFVTCTETTKTVENFHKLKMSDQRFQNLVREANVGIVVLSGPEMHIELVNEMYGRLIKRTPEELMGNNLFDVIPDAKAAFEPLLESVLNTGETIYLYDTPYSVNVKGEQVEGYADLVYQPYRETDDTISGVIVICHDVTEKKISQKKIEDSEIYFRDLIDTVPTIIWITDENGFCTFLNKNWYDFTGQSVEEAKGLGWLEATHPDDRKKTEKVFLKSNETHTPFSVLYRLKTKTGDYRWAIDKGTPKFDANGKYAGMIGSVTDVDDQKTAEAKIIKSENLLRNVINESPIRITFMTGPEMTIELVNETVLKTWKRDESVVGLPLKEALPELANQPFFDILSEVFRTGIPYSAKEAEVKFMREGREESFYYDIWYKPILDSQKKIYGILATAVDVTDKVTAQKKIEESEHRFRNVVESAPFPIGVYTKENLQIQLANQVMLDTWGKGNDVIGKSYKEILPELENQAIFEQILRVMETGVPFHAKNSRVDLVIDGKLSPFYFNYSFTPLFDSAGKVYAVMNTAADVTDLNITNLKLEQSEQRFKSLLAAAPIAIGVFLGRDLVIGTHNQTFIDIVGKGSDIYGKTLREVMPELITEGQPFLKILDDVITTGTMFQTFGTQVKIVQNGVMTYNYYDITYTPLYDLNNEVYGILDIAIDVTENVIAQQKIEESEKNLRNTILQAPVAMCLLKGENHFVTIVNERMLELWGKKNEDVIGKKLVDGLHEIKGQGFDVLLDKVYETGETCKNYDVSVLLPRKNGLEIVYVDFVYEAYKESDGKISGIMVIAIDVTVQAMARMKIEQAEESARLAIESADLGSYQTNLLTNEMHTSERFNEIWGIDQYVSREDLASRIHPDDLEMRKKAHQRSITTSNLHYEARIFWRDNTIHWVKIKGRVLYDDDNQPVTLIGVIQDITEQKQFAEELRKQVKQRTIELNRSNEDLLHFAHIASHDLKEPVRKIKVFSNMIEDQFGSLLPEKGKVYLDKVQNATDRMFAMIEGILTYSAVNASDEPIERIDLNDIISTIETDLEVLIHRKNAQFHIDTLPTIEGASILIYQLFYNLINNSLKFTKTDVAPIISIHSKPINHDGIDMAEIALKDNGIGIEQEHAMQIFNAFTRLNAKDKFEGTGLGLALCKKIVERHHGTITASGIKNEGTVFTILLPLKQSKKNV